MYEAPIFATVDLPRIQFVSDPLSKAPTLSALFYG